MISNPQSIIEDAKEYEFIEIINRCLNNLETSIGDTISGGIIIQRIINDIYLGTSDIGIKLNTLDKVYEKRKIITYLTDKGIQTAGEKLLDTYKYLLKDITDQKKRNEVEEKIKILSEEEEKHSKKEKNILETQEQRTALARVLKLQNTNTFKDYYNYLLEKFPEGLTGAKNIIPVTIDGNTMELVIFEPAYDYVSFGLFLTNQKYSRKTLEIHEDGQVNEDNIGIIPDFDLGENEPKFTSSDKEIVMTVIEEIKKKFDKKPLIK